MIPAALEVHECSSITPHFCAGCESLAAPPENIHELTALVRLDAHGCPAFENHIGAAQLTADVYSNQLADWERHKRPSAFAEMLSRV